MDSKLKPRDYVVLRGSRWYYRRRIPQALLDQYKPKTHVLESLETGDLARANEKAALRTLELDQEFAHRQALLTADPEVALSDEEVARIAKLWAADALSWDDTQRAQGFPLNSVENQRDGIGDFMFDWGDAYGRGDITPAAHLAHSALARHGLRLREDSATFRAVALAILSELIRVNEIILRRFDGDPIPTPLAEPVVLRSSPSVSPAQTLENLLGYWKLQKKRPPRTVQEAESAVREFERINGVLSASSYTKAHAVAFRDALLAEGSLAAATIVKKMNLLAALFNTAARNDKISSNPFVNVPRPPKAKRKVRGYSYVAAELTAIFSSPVFTNPSHRPKGGAGEAAYWLPLLALWTGGRLEEMGQLILSDVRYDQGIHYLSFGSDTEGDKTLKNESSERSVPLHPELIRCGFLNYVASVRAEGGLRLFSLVSSGGSRQHTAAFSQWWGRYARDDAGVTDTRKTFHSFRHTFKDGCRNSGIPLDIQQRLMGHVAERGVSGEYGQGHALATLAEAINRLRYDALDLSHLHERRARRSA